MTQVRLHFLDTLRGWTLLNMIAYHGLWNLVHLYGVKLDWYWGTWGYVWQQSICWIFILLSGFCWSMSRSHWKRGLLIFGGGLLVSVVTYVAMPKASITFGILTFLGSAVLLMIPLEKGLRNIPAVPGLLASSMSFCLLRNVGGGTFGFENLVLGRVPSGLYRNLLTAYIGFPGKDFHSTDYFPLLPWMGLFLVGCFLYRILHSRGWDVRFFGKGNIPGLSFLGRHSLLIYLLHQPILYGGMALWFR